MKLLICEILSCLDFIGISVISLLQSPRNLLLEVPGITKVNTYRFPHVLLITLKKGNRIENNAACSRFAVHNLHGLLVLVLLLVGRKAMVGAHLLLMHVIDLAARLNSKLLVFGLRIE